MNIRLFIVKLIINRAEVFAPYARQWLTPVMKTLLDHWFAVISTAKNQGQAPPVDAMDIDQAANSEAEGDKDDDAASTPDTSANAPVGEQSYGQVLNGFHYFTRDVCIVLLKWSDIGDLTNHKPSEEDKHVITQFIEFLMRHCAYHVRGIVYANLQLIRLLIERWKDVLHKTLSKVMQSGMGVVVDAHILSFAENCDGLLGLRQKAQSYEDLSSNRPAPIVRTHLQRIPLLRSIHRSNLRSSVLRSAAQQSQWSARGVQKCQRGKGGLRVHVTRD